MVCTGSVINDHAYNNVSPSVAAKIGKDLHRCSAHPLGIIKERCAPSKSDVRHQGYTVHYVHVSVADASEDGERDKFVNSQDCGILSSVRRV